MANNNLEIVEFCDKCNITLKEFGDLLKNDPNIDSFVFVKLVKELKIKLSDLIE